MKIVNMKNNEIKYKLEQLFDNSLSHSELRELVDIIESEGIDISELDDIRDLHNMLGLEIPIPEGSSLDSNFYSMLEEEGAGINVRGRLLSVNLMRIAAGIALFVLGWFGSQLLGNSDKDFDVAELSKEVSILRETLVLTKLQQNSPSERIKAVSMVGEMNNIDDAIVNGLLTALNNDPNDNVRLIALETLSNYAGNPMVVEGIIRSIELQTSPLIQLRMAHLMVALEEKRSVPGFRKILEDITLDYNVRTKLTETVEVLL